MKEIYFEEIDSTNNYLKTNFENLENYTIVRSSYQTSGRGRLNRSWVSKKNENLLFSILIKDLSLISKFNYLSIASAKVVAEILEEYNLNSSIKWPNDVFIDDEKVCGILLESHSANNIVDGIIIGIGINVNQKEFDDTLRIKATSLSNKLNKDVDIDLLKNKVFDSLINEFNKIKNNNYEFLNYVRNHNYLINNDVFADINNWKTSVKVIDINDDCSIKVLYNNQFVDLISGEISFHEE